MWIEKYKPLLWNISSINERDLQGRTNNCLERYNRHLNELFANAHPNLVAFIAAKQTLPINYIKFKSE
ncbi:hypothetical protein MXB_241 [Myxobolus squamalis]|nr:hypothetical protein MXB_241 [Myxobolus squamalis]